MAMRLRALLAALAATLYLTAAAHAAPPPESKSGDCKPGPTGFFKDEGLVLKLTTKLQFNKRLLRERIAVKVSQGVATLSGGVSTQEHIATAMSLARQVNGIVCINNFMHVGPPDPVSEPQR